MRRKLEAKDIIGPLVIAIILAVGGTLATHDRELSGLSEKIKAVHEDVKIIKETLLKRGLED